MANKEMNQPVATYTERDFERVLMRDYPVELHAEVRAILDVYGKEKGQQGQLRVRMACLKLAVSNLADLRKYVLNACIDYRDVLAWAEYPAYMRAHGPAEQKKAIEQDWEQLQKWLHRK